MSNIGCLLAFIQKFLIKVLLANQNEDVWGI